jgi:hypothetical protein
MKPTFLQLLIAFMLLLGLVLRLYRIDSLPPFNRDEASIGYNAYSLLKTGRDEWGVPWPLSFKSFGDYKMPGYLYASLLPVKLWGLHEITVRFWSVLAGLGTLGALYFLTRWLVAELKLNLTAQTHLPWLAVALHAVNPWHVFFSRVGFEANLNLGLFLWGVTGLLYSAKHRPLFVGSALCFGLMFYTYSSSVIFLPLFLLVWGVILRRQLGKLDIWLGLGLAILVALSVHASWSVWQVSQAKTNITIFSDPSIIDRYHHLRSDTFATSPVWAKLWLNRPFFYGRLLASNYLKSFSPSFLIIKAGNHPWHQIPGMGHFYWLDLGVMGAGLVALLKLKQKTVTWLLASWLVLSPLPSAITVDAPHATRMIQIVPAIILVLVLGWQFIWRQVTPWSRSVKRLIIGLGVGLYLFQIARFGYLFFVAYPQKLPWLLQGVDQALAWVRKEDPSRLVIFTQPYDYPYIYVVFYTRFDPAVFQQEAVWRVPNLANLTTVEEIGRFRFWEGVPKIKEKAFYVLPSYAGSPKEFTLKQQILREGQVDWNIFAN